MVVHPQIQTREDLRPLDAQRDRLLAALVAAGVLARLHGRDQALDDGQAGVGLPRGQGPGDHPRSRQHVARHRDARLGQMPAPVDAASAGVGGGCAAGVDDVELALVDAAVHAREHGDDVGRAVPLGEQAEGAMAELGVGQRLAHRRAVRPAAPRAERAHREELRGDGQPEQAAFGVFRKNGPGHGIPSCPVVPIMPGRSARGNGNAPDRGVLRSRFGGARRAGPEDFFVLVHAGARSRDAPVLAHVEDIAPHAAG